MSSSGGGGDGWRPTPTPGSVPKKPGGGTGGGSGGGDPNDPCFIVEIANLNSVNQAALAAVSVGSQLDIELQKGPPQRLLAKNGSNTVGSITSRSLPQLILCISQGRTYKAEVVALQGAICQVRIHPA